MTKKGWYGIATIIGLIIVAAAVWYFSSYFNLETAQHIREYLHNLMVNHYWQLSIGFLIFYTAAISIGLPAVIPLTLLAGYLFGIVIGFIYAEIACVVGSVISYTLMRLIFVRWIDGWYNPKIEHVKERIATQGAWYLLMIQFLALFPLFVINLLAALAHVPLITVIWTTAVGSIPFLGVLVFAGQRLGQISSVKELFSPPILILFGVLALMCLLPGIIKRFTKPSSSSEIK